MNKLTRMHPGEYLQEVYITPLNLKSSELAKAMGVSHSALSRLINMKSDLSCDMAHRLSMVVGRSPESWMSLQTSYSLLRVKMHGNFTDVTNGTYHPTCGTRPRFIWIDSKELHDKHLGMHENTSGEEFSGYSDKDEGFVFDTVKKETVMNFGNYETYYPTCGTKPSDKHLAIMLRALNEEAE